MKSSNFQKKQAKPISPNTLKVLLIEDDEDDYIFVQDLLLDSEQHQYELTWASNYEQGLIYLANEQFHICLVDFRLGASNGLDLIRSVSQNTTLPAPPMIMLTGQADSQCDIDALRAGAIDFLEKAHLNSASLERAMRYAMKHKSTINELEHREQELRVITQELDDGLLVTDESHNILFINPAALAMLNFPKGRKVPEQFRFQLHHGDNEVTLQHHEKSLVLEVHRTKTHWRGNPADMLTLHDITAHRQTQETLRVSEERYALAASGSNDGLWDWQLAQNRIYFSPRWLDMAGFTQDKILDTPEAWFRLIHPEDLDGFKKAINNHLNGLSAHLKYTYRIRHIDSGYRWMLCRGRAVFNEKGEAYRMAGSQTDITNQKQAEEQLRHDVLHDNLTGLPNQALFFDRLYSIFAMHKRQPELGFALMFIDVDDFKVINDSLGHIHGDRLLVKLARRLKNCIRPCDTVAHISGDEFALILPQARDRTSASQIALRIQDALEKPFKLEDQELFISSSMGIALADHEYQKPEDLLRDADTAMYRAKQAGKNNYMIFQPEMHQAALKRLQVETELRKAVSKRELVPFFQPIVNLENGNIAGFEALVRWNTPNRGFIPPGEFIPISEETGLVILLGEQVLDKTCQYRQDWLNIHPHAYISVNLSPRQLADPSLPDRVMQIIESYSLPAELIRLEITESALMDNASQALQILNKFREHKLKIYLDDFGTGYSSLSYLHTFPIDVLKIDQSFVNRLEDNSGKARQIVEGILNLSGILNIDVIAEGIETETQQKILQDLGCRFGQGYYYSKPVDAESALSLLRGVNNNWKQNMG